MDLKFLMTQFFVSALIYAFAIYAWRRKSPMYFFIGVEIRATRFKNVTKYNHGVACLWFLYGSSILATALIHLLGEFDLSRNLAQSVPILGILFVVLGHGLVYLKYRR